MDIRRTIPVGFYATLESPLLLRDLRLYQRAKSLDHLPGSTVRGMLGWAYVREYGDDLGFRAIFLSGASRFPFLYPSYRSWEKPYDKLQGTKDKPYLAGPYPLTAFSCKRHPKSIEEGGHGIVDLLRPFAMVVPEDTASLQGLEGCLSCQVCGQDRKPHSGYRVGRGRAIKAPPHQIRMGVGIEASTRTAADGVLFQQVVLDAWTDAPSLGLKAGEGTASKQEKLPSFFAGRGFVPEEALPRLQELCKIPLAAGAARSRGFGGLTMEIQPLPDDSDERHERLALWQKTWREMWAEAWKKAKKADIGKSVLLTLRTPAILLDDFLRDHLDLEAELKRRLRKAEAKGFLTQEEALALKGLRVEYTRARPKRILSWNALQGIPREDEMALDAGSTFLVAFPQETALQALQSFVRLLEAEGVGDRRDEGFGQVTACDPFHLP